jgi:SAM-dependent methyltransferase
MNYVRLMELPLAWDLLDPAAGHRVLDIGSPKLLALCLAVERQCQLTITDADPYFVDDFRIFRQLLGFTADVGVVDARSLPFAAHSFDSVFSVSVFEHISAEGDRLAVAEAARVLRQHGVLVLTVPVNTRYMEEWSVSDVYWNAERRPDGAVFYQRRYDQEAVRERLRDDRLKLEQFVLIAEQPFDKPRMGSDGRWLHNFELLRRNRWVMRLQRLARKGVPLLPYLVHRVASRRAHYLTQEWQDPNIRQVVLRFRRH